LILLLDAAWCRYMFTLFRFIYIFSFHFSTFRFFAIYFRRDVSHYAIFIFCWHYCWYFLTLRAKIVPRCENSACYALPLTARCHAASAQGAHCHARQKMLYAREAGAPRLRALMRRRRHVRARALPRVTRVTMMSIRQRCAWALAAMRRSRLIWARFMPRCAEPAMMRTRYAAATPMRHCRAPPPYAAIWLLLPRHAAAARAAILFYFVASDSVWYWCFAPWVYLMPLMMPPFAPMLLFHAAPLLRAMPLILPRCCLRRIAAMFAIVCAIILYVFDAAPLFTPMIFAWWYFRHAMPRCRLLLDTPFTSALRLIFFAAPPRCAAIFSLIIYIILFHALRLFRLFSFDYSSSCLFYATLIYFSFTIFILRFDAVWCFYHDFRYCR